MRISGERRSRSEWVLALGLPPGRWPFSLSPRSADLLFETAYYRTEYAARRLRIAFYRLSVLE